jgi:hypothetical protein
MAAPWTSQWVTSQTREWPGMKNRRWNNIREENPLSLIPDHRSFKNQKMKISLKLCCCLLGLVHAGCSYHTKNSADTASNFINMNLDESNSKIELSSLFSDFSIIQLEGGINHYIKDPARIRIFNNSIFVFDRTLGSLLIYNNQGKFIREVIRKGKGPGEAVKPFDFDIDTSKKQLLVLDLDLKQVLHFSLDGDFLFVEKNKFQSFYISSLGLGKLAYYIGYFGLDHFNLQIKKDQGEEFKSLFPFPEKMYPMHFPFTGYMTKNNKGILYTDACSNNIFQVNTDGTFSLKYSFDFGSKAWDESKRFEFNEFFASISRFETDFLRSYFEESQEGLVFEYQIGNRYWTGYYLTMNNSLFLPNKNLQYDSFCKGINSPRGVTEDGRFISFIEPNIVKLSIIEQEKKGLKTGFDTKLREQIMSSDLETGIFLVLYRLNKNED